MNVTWSWRSWMLLLLQTLPGCPCKDRFALWAHSWVQQSSWCRFSIFVEGVPAISFHSSCLHISYHVSYHISTDLSPQQNQNWMNSSLRPDQHRRGSAPTGQERPDQSNKDIAIALVTCCHFFATCCHFQLVCTYQGCLIAGGALHSWRAPEQTGAKTQRISKN